MSEYQPAACYLPHAAPMVLVERVIMVSDEEAHCQVRISPDGVLAPFLTPEGALPAWFGIEIIAQTIGVWSGWHGRQQQQQAPRPGMLLGGRGYRCQQAQFPAGSVLDVRVSLLMRDEKMGSFDGVITIDGNTWASGRLNTYQPDEQELQQIMQQDIQE
ncbi:ApeP family dehydratase [Erwinia sorbitola]|uniref:3-hydroxy-fatty acyl-ACP dehydratase n=1 Tax=Erwinia sorbitola TaxID=2681984 RepID=A0ABW9R5K5_9GAMM|nr:hotdog family protein [Erwinia sorbitola]MTD25359.1 3-hydroxy-fatty acyl-ACP dehydratase [Erwinia sorbitola]